MDEFKHNIPLNIIIDKLYWKIIVLFNTIVVLSNTKETTKSSFHIF